MIVDSGAALGAKVFDGDARANGGFTLKTTNLAYSYSSDFFCLSATHSISLGDGIDLNGAMFPRHGLQGCGIALDGKLSGYLFVLVLVQVHE